MDAVYEPPRRASLNFTLSLGFLALVGALVLLILGSGTTARDPSLLFIILAVLLLVVGFFFSYRAFLILTTRYFLKRSSLELHWGFQQEIIPLDRVEWAHPVSDFDSPMPLPGFLLPWQYYGKRNIRGLGVVEFVATDKQNMVLIRADNRHFVISPVDAHAFAQDFENACMLGVAEPIEPVSQNLRSMLGEIFQDATAKKLLIAGLLGVLLLTAVTFTLSATRLTVTWTTLEQVPSNRLLLLSLVGVLAWLLNTVVGAYIFLRGLLEKRWIFLIWGWSVLISLILTLAAVFMSLGSA
jgi:hypothetical protein